VVAIRPATAADAARMAELAEQKREQYKAYAPVFYRPKPDSRELHAAFLASQIDDEERHLALVHETEGGRVDGFLIATVVPPPPVYDPGGLTCLVDDFLVEAPALWPTVGRELLRQASRLAELKGAVQTVVVCGPEDEPKRAVLVDTGHIVASEWFTRPLSG
jgi:hypothetical protein